MVTQNRNTLVIAVLGLGEAAPCTSDSRGRQNKAQAPYPSGLSASASGLRESGFAWCGRFTMIRCARSPRTWLARTPSIATRYPTHTMIPPTVRASNTFRHAFLVASAGWLCGHTLRAVIRLWLLANLPLELYLIADTVAGWPINLSLVAFTTWYPLRQLRRAGLASGAPNPLSAVDAVELAVEETAPTTV